MNLYTADTIHGLLLQKKLLTEEDFIWGDYEATSINRRNRNVQVTTSNNKNYLIKQVFDKNSDNAKTLLTELNLYKYIKENFSEIQSCFPQVNYACPEDIILILEFYKNAVPLWKYYKQKGITDMPLKTISSAGNLLAKMHNSFRNGHIGALPFLSNELPFAFYLHQPQPKILSYIHQGGLDFIESIQNDKELVNLFDTAHKNWEINSLIHGDIKLDNLLVIVNDTEDESTELKLIDWEMAQYGDRAWDVAGGLQDFIFWWVIMMPEHDTAAEMIKNARFSFKDLAPSIFSYWDSYSNVIELHPEAKEELLDKAIQFSGFRCLQTAYEIATKFDSIPPIASVLLNLGKSIIKNPALAKEKLFCLALQPEIL
jgi:thiamine kinase-like enzyme